MLVWCERRVCAFYMCANRVSGTAATRRLRSQISVIVVRCHNTVSNAFFFFHWRRVGRFSGMG